MTSKPKYIRLDPDLAEWVEKEAEKENRSFRNYVETVLMEHRREKVENNKV